MGDFAPFHNGWKLLSTSIYLAVKYSSTSFQFNACPQQVLVVFSTGILLFLRNQLVGQIEIITYYAWEC